MSEEVVALNALRWGFHSNEWLLSAALPHVPRENLELAVRTQAYYLLHTGVLSLHTQLDMMAQIALTGAYVPTAFPEPEGETGDHPDGQIHNPENPGTSITEEEIDTFGKMFDRLVDPNAGPDSE